MAILRSLGVDETLFIHLICFLISYVALTELLLKPYYAAYLEREKRTVGSEEAAVRLTEEATDLQNQYALKARELNAEAKGYYDRARQEASKKSEAIIFAARDEASKSLQENRQRISEEVQKAKKILANEIPTVGAAIASKLAGKDLSL